MTSITISRVFLLISVAGIKYVKTTQTSSGEESFQVPAIEDCAYVDAYSVTCWWTRPPDDNVTVYRLGHISSSYHPDENDEKYCENVHSRVTDDGVQIEECGFEKASLFMTYKFWIEVFTKLDDKYFPTGLKSGQVTFTASELTVKLTAPPLNLDIEDDGQLLTWSEPEKEHSNLIYVTTLRDLLYKVECRKHSVTKEETWKECYKGLKRESPLSHLIPGTSYELRVFASLDHEFTDDGSSAEEDREWSEPSDVLVYAVPAPPEIIDETVKDGSKVETVAISISTVVAILLLAMLAGIFMYWKGCCCFELKFIKPNTLIDLDTKSEEIITSENALMGDYSSREEQIYPVTMADEFDWIVRDLRHKKEGAYKITLTNEIAEQDLKRHFIRSFNEDNVATSQQDETTSNGSGNADNEMMRMKILGKQKQKFQSKQNLDEESVEYMTFIEKDDGIPAYTLTDSDEKCESHGSQESINIDMEYVMEYTSVDPTATSSGSYSQGNKPQEGYKPTKVANKTEINIKSETSFPYDDIPDYVIQTSASYEDFARTMTSFLHTLTLAEKNNDNEHQTTDILPDTSLRSRLTNHESISSRDADNCDLGCYESDSDVYLTSERTKDFRSEEMLTTKSKITLNRSGSGSLPSIDSGYSAETSEVS